MTSQTYADDRSSLAATAPRDPSTPSADPARLDDTRSMPADRLLDGLLQMVLRLRLRGSEFEHSIGLAGRELDLVAMLTAAGQTSVKSLVADLGLPRSTMTAIVDRLEARQLVRRRPNPTDRRSILLEAMPNADAAVARYRDQMLTLVRHLDRVLSESECEQLVALIEKIERSFQSPSPQP